MTVLIRWVQFWLAATAMMRRSALALLVVGPELPVEAQVKIPAQSTLFVDEMEHDLDNYLKAELGTNAVNPNSQESNSQVAAAIAHVSH